MRGRIAARLGDGDGAAMNYWCDTGEEYDNDTPPIIRIERLTSAPAPAKPRKAKVDTQAQKDAAWLRRHADAMVLTNRESEAPRLRAIARRIGGGAK